MRVQRDWIEVEKENKRRIKHTLHIKVMIYSYKKTMNLDSKNLDKYYYEILGTAGVTIGHELTHALDSQGSKYDGDGNYINWWTEEDLENFNKLNIEVVKYYNTYEQFGTSTLAENIADLGGM